MSQELPQTVIDIDKAIELLDQRHHELSGGVDTVASSPRSPNVVKEECNSLAKLIVTLKDTRDALLAA